MATANQLFDALQDIGGLINENSSFLFDSALRNLQSSQTDVVRSREQLASGKNLVRARMILVSYEVETLESLKSSTRLIPTSVI